MATPPPPPPPAAEGHPAAPAPPPPPPAFDPEFAKALVEDVVSTVRPSFFQEGAGEEALTQLRSLWMAKIESAGLKGRQAGAPAPADGKDDEAEATPAVGEKRKRDEDGDEEKKQADEDPDALNSDDDDDSDEEEVKELLLAQYESVTRTRDRWRVELKDGVVNVNGREVPFSRAKADVQF